MPTAVVRAAPGYRTEEVPDLSSLEVRQRLSPAALRGFFKLVNDWSLNKKQTGGLLGGVAVSTLYKWQRSPSAVLSQDRLTRISYLLGIDKALHILLPGEIADSWMTRSNTDPMFRGNSPIDLLLHAGIDGFRSVRRLLDAATQGH